VPETRETLFEKKSGLTLSQYRSSSAPTLSGSRAR
jgi:hypothetical protein